MQKIINGVYIVVNAVGQPYVCTAGDTAQICIERAEFVLDDLWENLYAEGYRVAVASLTIQRVLTDAEVLR